MEKVITLEGLALGRLIERIRATANGEIYRLRVAVDAGDLKFKVNEGTWSPPYNPEPVEVTYS